MAVGKCGCLSKDDKRFVFVSIHVPHFVSNYASDVMVMAKGYTLEVQ